MRRVLADQAGRLVVCDLGVPPPPTKDWCGDPTADGCIREKFMK
jgi:hypothetical protein